MSVTTTSLRQGKFETRFWHKVFEEEVGRVKGHFGPINTFVEFSFPRPAEIYLSILFQHCRPPERYMLRFRIRGRLRSCASF